MIPFHLFLFSFFKKKEQKEMTLEEYQNSLLVQQTREQSNDIRNRMNHYM
ncbi:hypothetical protein JOC85_001511 [Bacillus mesophilus]|uniref:Uncharacterized protein n=1 Tax=Bacillus mesophilus TaxID=1808955 RepID=A0A6M0Q5Z8_9BACI|nr:hypothetical protein [Bacillus mesophilus]MBM7660739.1 hypothetical protein [Bacillus mesophilus]NEY71714.1 hypothetical protein [Bacillus mesophilus]